MNKPARDPIDRVVWRQASELNANDYNPNAVFTPELRLLERSILLTGWVQPILIDPRACIIDGFHRQRLSLDSAAIRKIYGGEVPCATIDVSRSQAMLLTIRMNRAKGTHVAVRMSAIIHELIDVHHLDPAEIAQEIGATLAEVDLLHQDGIFAARNIADYPYSKAWYPVETKARA